MVVDAFVYHKYCKSRRSTWYQPCSLSDNAKCLVVKLGTIPPLIVVR
jgi:hypothetical protein